MHEVRRSQRGQWETHNERVGAGRVLELEREVAGGAGDALGEGGVDLHLSRGAIVVMLQQARRGQGRSLARCLTRSAAIAEK